MKLEITVTPWTVLFLGALQLALLVLHDDIVRADLYGLARRGLLEAADRLEPPEL